jgi:hypothetical protein
MRVSEKTKPIQAARGRDWGLRIGDSRIGKPVPLPGHRAKQTQSATFGYILGSFDWAQGIEIRETRSEIRADRVDRMPNKPNCGDTETHVTLFEI